MIKKKRKKQRLPWTEEDLQYLIDNYDKHGMVEIRKHFPHRSVAAIDSQVVKLRKEGRMPKIGRTARWTKEEEKYLLENYSTMGARKIAEKFNKTTGSVASKYYYLQERERLRKQREGKMAKPSEELRDYGIGRELRKLKFKLGQAYVVQPRSKKDNLWTTFKGKLILETDDFILLEGKWKECFMKKDFLIGDYQIKEVV